MTEDIEVTDEEVETYFENQGYQIEAQHILLTDEELAEKVAKEAQDDGDFAKLAEKYSTDEENAKEGGELPPDRKSTRLNSSHVAISYAVFCLKKKITTS